MAQIRTDGNCPTAGCGLNGIWLGGEVPFRTLHTSPLRRNEAGLSLVAFRDASHQPLAPEIVADVLRGVLSDGTPKSGRALNGATILLTDVTKVCADDFAQFVGDRNLLMDLVTRNEPDDGGPSGAAAQALLSDIQARTATTPGCGAEPHPPIYEIAINDVPDLPFWERATDRQGNVTTPVYAFQASVVNAGRCEVQVCRPGLTPPSDDDPHGILGSAVMFRGDYYGDPYRVLDGPAHSDDDDVFNIACLGTTLSKLHLLRHTLASHQGTSAPPLMRRQAMMDLLTADYCGDGHPFTTDGVPLRIAFAGAHAELTPESGYRIDACATDKCTVDAVWLATGAGAKCIGTPRIQGTALQIQSGHGPGCAVSDDGKRVTCRDEVRVRCERPRCEPATISPATSADAWPSDAYVISANPSS